MDIFSVLKFICGISFFLFGMKIMSSELEKLTGGRLEAVLRRVTAKPFLSLLLGAAITVAMQSSSAVTVMLVGLVNSGIMAFSQTVAVTYGANIGTTLTAWILSLSGLSGDSIVLQLMKPENFSPILAFIGVFFAMFSKKEKRKSIGSVFVGFAVLMYGMSFMTESVAPLAEMPEFSSFVGVLDNPFLGVLIGMVFTCVIQSSAASMGILQALAISGSITYKAAAPVVMGLNIGTCITAVLSSVGATPKAKRVAFMHTAMNVFGTVICLTLFEAVELIFSPALFSENATAWGIAAVHTAFNVVTAAVLMPFTKQLVHLAERVIKDSPADIKKDRRHYAPDERLLGTPSVAVKECFDFTLKMNATADKMLDSAFNMLFDYDKKTAAEIADWEEELDLFEDALGTYLVKISSAEISDADSRRVSGMLRAIGNFERLGDHALNLLDASAEINEKKIKFSGSARRETEVLEKALREIISLTTNAFSYGALNDAAHVEPLEEVVDGLTEKAKANHVERLKKGECTIEQGFVFNDIMTNFERISDHCSNIAGAVLELDADGAFDMHRYLNGVKTSHGDFDRDYEIYSEKYAF